MEMRCRNCTGIGGTEYILAVLETIPARERVEYAEQNAERLRAEYCNLHCPTRKFETKYHPVQPEPMFVGSRI